jgi:hypothetical protein
LNYTVGGGSLTFEIIVLKFAPVLNREVGEDSYVLLIETNLIVQKVSVL